MRMSEGVEWATHALALLAALPKDRALPAAAIAGFHELPPQYMAKHLQALARAGLVTSSRGAGGGYRLARRARDISLMDVADALEGPHRAFRCQEIRRKGPCATPAQDCRAPCAVARVFWAAEDSFRQALAGVSVADVAREVGEGMDAERAGRLAAWMAETSSPAR